MIKSKSDFVERGTQVVTGNQAIAVYCRQEKGELERDSEVD